MPIFWRENSNICDFSTVFGKSSKSCQNQIYLNFRAKIDVYILNCNLCWNWILWHEFGNNFQTCSGSFWKGSGSDPFFKKDLDQDPFRITSEKRIWIRSFSDHLQKKDLDQDPFRITSEKRIWITDHGSKDPYPDHDPWSRSWILDLQIKISSHYWVTFSL